MRAFLFYIDDWLSSKKVALMDAHEERGYLRLLLHEATEPDGGLPDDDNQLAIFSLLGSQWFKASKDRTKRTGKTSGEKLRECFQSRDGRLFNARLLKEWSHQKQVAEAKRKAGLSGGRPVKQTKSICFPDDKANGKQTETNDVWDSACASASASSFASACVSENTTEVVVLERFNDADYQSFQEYVGMFIATGKALNECDLMNANREWISRDSSYRKAAFEHAQTECLRWAGDEYTPFPVNHLKTHPWTRRSIERVLPTPHRKSKSELGQEAAERMFTEGKR